MKVKCPYCGQTFETDKSGPCPHCGRTAIVPGPSAPGAGAPVDPARITAEQRFSPPPSYFLRTHRSVQLALVVVGVLAVTLLALSRLRNIPPGANENRKELAERNLAVLCIALDRFQADCGRYPSSAEGLAVLARNPGLAGWKGPYIERLKNDPWRRAYAYASDTARFTLSSAGPDGEPGTADDILALQRDPKPTP